MTPGSLGPGLAGEAGKSVLICRFNKCGECAHLWGKGWEEARAARQAVGRGTATGKEDFMATRAQGGGELYSHLFYLENSGPSERNFSGHGDLSGVFRCHHATLTSMLEVWKGPE